MALYLGSNKIASGGTGISLLDVYPIGSIYMSVNPTNPSTLFGGTWKAWGSGKVPVGVDTTQTEFNTVEKTGGEKVHTLTVDEMPNHSHFIDFRKSKNFNSGNIYNAYFPAFATPLNWENAPNQYTNSEGKDHPHNNLQPYITCYMWKRTA